MKKELVKSAEELLRQAAELAASAAEMMEQGKDVPAETLAEVQRLSRTAQTMLNEKRAKPQVSIVRKLTGTAILVGMILYFIPELRQDVVYMAEWLSGEWRRGK